ncbi:MAG: hypothetical protein ACRC78_03035 [Planktothrix sp.]
MNIYINVSNGQTVEPINQVQELSFSRNPLYRRISLEKAKNTPLTPQSTPTLQFNVNTMSTAQLEERMIPLVIAKLISAARKTKPFESIDDLIERVPGYDWSNIPNLVC